MQTFLFPFGQELKKVEQIDRSPKEAFVLGVYASAVHARWVDVNGKQKVAALAVASEPEIFWTGIGAQKIIDGIKIPKELGKLTNPTNKELNGPSGRALNDFYLKPLGLTRKNTWLCDLLPESRVNQKQKNAIESKYHKALKKGYNLNPATIPVFNKSELNSSVRRIEILEELEMSKANTIILLGDLPIKWFLHFHVDKYSKLSQFGKSHDDYGKKHELKINNKYYRVIPLCHPRQAAGLGVANTKWKTLHHNWINLKQ